MEKQVITRKFDNWEELPDITHLLKIKNSYVKAAEGDIIYVSYVIEDDKIVAFGSAGYYKDDNYYGKNKTRQLWIEGMVSTSKGCGSIILSELEKALETLADLHSVKYKIINVMSVDESVAFYENNGYVECNTSTRFRGTDNTRMAKPIEDFSLETAKIRTNWEIDPEWIFGFVVTGRRKILQKYMNLPENIHHSSFIKYILENSQTVFHESIPNSVKDQVIEFLIQGEI